MPIITMRQNLTSLIMPKGPNHDFLVKDDVPCHLAYDAGLDAVDGQ
jgi:hypothetical protein